MGFNRFQLRELSLNAFYQAEHLRNRRSRVVYKYVLYPQLFAPQFIHLTTQSRAGLCRRQLISSSPLNQNRYFHCTAIYRIHRGPAARQCLGKILLSAHPLCQPASRSKRQDSGWLVQVSMQRCLRYSSRLSRSTVQPLGVFTRESANIHVAGM